VRHQLICENELTVIPGATHLFEEPGALGTGRAAGCQLVRHPPRSAHRWALGPLDGE